MKITLSLPKFSARIFMRRKLKKQLKAKIGGLTKQLSSVIVEMYNHMIRRLALLALWLVATPSLILALGVVLSLEKSKINISNVTASFQTLDVEKSQNDIQGQVLATQINDARPFIVERFLKGTPLAPYSGYIVEVSDKYSIDYRLIPAIAMKESGGGSAVSEISHNAWGFENGRTIFPSWPYAIDRVGQTLKVRYVSQGLTTPDEIMAKYAPPQLETGGKWARDVNFFFSQMETL